MNNRFVAFLGYWLLLFVVYCLFFVPLFMFRSLMCDGVVHGAAVGIGFGLSAFVSFAGTVLTAIGVFDSY